MPRFKRLVIPGMPHHVVQRGNRRMNVFLDAFYMDRFEISNERFARFVKETGYPALKNFTFHAGQEKYPATGLGWYDAKAYCEWAHKRLPLEYEWEKAARGSDGRTWPWGKEPKTPSGGVRLINLPEYNDPPGQSPYGCLHMADNVWEWVDDWFGAYVLSDMKDPRFGKIFKVLRGGLALDSKMASYAKTTDRYPLKPDQRNDSTGARCAMDADSSP